MVFATFETKAIPLILFAVGHLIYAIIVGMASINYERG